MRPDLFSLTNPKNVVCSITTPQIYAENEVLYVKRILEIH